MDKLFYYLLVKWDLLFIFLKIIIFKIVSEGNF